MEIALSQEIFVPRSVMLELWTMREHVQCWFPFAIDDLLNATIETPTDAQSCLRWTSNAEPDTSAPPDSAKIQLCVNLTELGGKTRIDLKAAGFTRESTCERFAEQWRVGLRQLEDYLAVI